MVLTQAEASSALTHRTLQRPRMSIATKGRGSASFSFGSNDLTRTTDDFGSFLPDYLEQTTNSYDPFVRLEGRPRAPGTPSPTSRWCGRPRARRRMPRRAGRPRAAPPGPHGSFVGEEANDFSHVQRFSHQYSPHRY